MTQNNPKIAIIIVNWNGEYLLKNCLDSVFKQTYKDFIVFLVDNGSKDNSAKFVEQNYTKVNLIQLDKNTGFAKGNNIGIKEAFRDEGVEYIVCLNNDTIVDKNWLKELIKTAEKSDKIGAVQSKILLADGKTIHSTGMRFVNDLQGDKNGGLSIGFGEPSNRYNKEIEIFAPTGASVLFKRKVLEQVGLFDEDFFAYVEDFDLGWRIRNKGYISIYQPKSEVIHLHSQTGGSASPFKAYYLKRNIYFTAIKNFTFLDLVLFPFRDTAWNFRNLFKKNRLNSVSKLKKDVGFFGLVWITLRADLSILFYTPKMFMKRWRIHKEWKKNKIY